MAIIYNLLNDDVIVFMIFCVMLQIYLMLFLIMTNHNRID